jgi:hypothetical protein
VSFLYGMKFVIDSLELSKQQLAPISNNIDSVTYTALYFMFAFIVSMALETYASHVLKHEKSQGSSNE